MKSPVWTFEWSNGTVTVIHATKMVDGIVEQWRFTDVTAEPGDLPTVKTFTFGQLTNVMNAHQSFHDLLDGILSDHDPGPF